MPGQKISEADRQKINLKYICSKCDLLLTEPMQTPCGHFMCHSCVEIMCSSSNPVCPKDGNHFKKEEVHLYSCCHGLIECVHAQCKKMMKRSLLAEHLETECLYRQITCAYCNEKLSFNLLKEHVDVECLETPLTCKHCGMAGIPRKDITKHETVECEEIIGFHHAKISKPGPDMNTMSDFKKRLENLEQRNRNVEWLLTRLDQSDRSPAFTADLSNQHPSTTSSTGTWLWKIDNFKRKRRDPAFGAQTAIDSPHFYTSQFGYKMCVGVYLNGDGFGIHISLFFVVMKGDYDALLPWPFQKKITMMLLDQNNGDHMIHAFHSDPESCLLERPKDMNIASKSSFFTPLDGLSNRAYVKDDTMLIKIIVD